MLNLGISLVASEEGFYLQKDGSMMALGMIKFTIIGVAS